MRNLYETLFCLFLAQKVNTVDFELNFKELKLNKLPSDPRKYVRFFSWKWYENWYWTNLDAEWHKFLKETLEHKTNEHILFIEIDSDQGGVIYHSMQDFKSMWKDFDRYAHSVQLE